MKKLARSRQNEMSRIQERLREAAAGLEEAVGTANEAISQAHRSLVEAADAYNEAVEEAEAFRDDVVSEMEGYADERSEKWRDSDRGQAYESWMNQWRELGFDKAEFDEPADFWVPTFGIPDELEQLPLDPAE